MSESKIDIANITFNHPPSWRLIKIKHLLSTKVTDGPHETPTFIDNGYPFLSVDSIVDGKLVFEGCRYISKEDYDKYKLKCNPQKDDVFMGKAASIGKIAIVDVDFNFSIWSPLALLRSNQKMILPKFLEYSLKSDYAQDQIDLYSTSNTQKNISMDDIPRIELLVPDLEKQKTIIQYLDTRTTNIDKNISKNEELISLLEEKKVALINQVVTKGLNPDISLKDSGVKWIGKIPQHWDVHKIKNLIFFQEGPGLRNWQFTDDGIRVICVTNITERGIDFSKYEKFISPNEYKQTYSHFTVDKGDLLLSSSGNSWGKVAEYDGEETVILNTSTIRINKNPSSDYELNQPYIKWVLQSDYVREQLGLMMTGSCQPNFGPTHLAKVLIALPTPDEQNMIAKYLDDNILIINSTIDKIRDNISLLEEYKTSLIHNVVTGKMNIMGDEV